MTILLCVFPLLGKVPKFLSLLFLFFPSIIDKEVSLMAEMDKVKEEASK